MFLASNGCVIRKESTETNKVFDGEGPPGIKLAESSLVRFGAWDLCGDVEVNEEVEGRDTFGNPAGAVEVGYNEGGEWTFELGLVNDVLNDLVYLGCMGNRRGNFL